MSERLRRTTETILILAVGIGGFAVLNHYLPFWQTVIAAGAGF